MRHVSSYKELFENQTELSPEQIEWLDKFTSRGIWELNPQTGLVDIDGDFWVPRRSLTDFRGVRFGRVSGFFSCSDNSLTSLEGSPRSVGGGFSCADNRLTTLKGAPKTITRDFYCANNQLTSLEGAPQTVGGGFYCHGNQLTSLEGAPKTITRDFYCAGNPVSETTLKAIFKLMRNGKTYQQALEEYWPNMGEEDRVLMYKEMPDLPQEDAGKYKALATYAKIKGYL